MSENPTKQERNREAVRRYRARHLETVRERSRESTKRYRQTDKGHAVKVQQDEIDRIRGKRPARDRVTKAVRNGRLVRGPCSVCGAYPTHGHHHNGYADPLDVIWLCPVHHSEAHRG